MRQCEFSRANFLPNLPVERIVNAKLCEAIRNAERGLIDADYGGAE
jgi:hypothetical protein